MMMQYMWLHHHKSVIYILYYSRTCFERPPYPWAKEKWSFKTGGLSWEVHKFQRVNFNLWTCILSFKVKIIIILCVHLHFMLYFSLQLGVLFILFYLSPHSDKIITIFKWSEISDSFVGIDFHKLVAWQNKFKIVKYF